MGRRSRLISRTVTASPSASAVGAWVLGILDVGEHGQGVGVVGQQDGGAVLAEGTQPGQQHPGPDAGRGVGQVDAEEPRQRPVPKSRGQVVEGRVDAGERRPGRDDQKGCGDERLREDDTGDGVGQPATEQPAERGVRADEVDEQDAAHHRRQRQRKLDEDAHNSGRFAIRPGQPAGQRYPEQCDQQHRDGGALGGCPQRRPQARAGEPLVVGARQPDDERRQREREIHHEQAAEPHQRAAAASPGAQCADSTPFRLAGTPVPVTIGGFASTKPSLLRTACPAEPSKYFTNASAPASSGAWLSTLMV